MLRGVLLTAEEHRFGHARVRGKGEGEANLRSRSIRQRRRTLEMEIVVRVKPTRKELLSVRAGIVTLEYQHGHTLPMRQKVLVVSAEAETVLCCRWCELWTRQREQLQETIVQLYQTVVGAPWVLSAGRGRKSEPSVKADRLLEVGDANDQMIDSSFHVPMFYRC